MYNPLNMEGKTILITGASSGIGRSVAVECSRLGATCVITGRDTRRLRETRQLMQDAEHQVIAADLAAEDEVAALVEQLPMLDGVSHNAGINRTQVCSSAKREIIEELLNVNLLSTIELQTKILRKKKLNKGASLVMMSSVSAVTHKFGYGFYGISKMGLAHYAQDLAKELGRRSIRVNAVLPGMVDTPRIRSNPAFSEEIYLRDQRQNYALGRYGKPEEISHLVAFLLSDAASWITGSLYIVDGGFML